MTIRTLLITGASSGIGRALTLEYASRGAHVAVAARRKSDLDALVREITDRGGRASAYTLDVRDIGAVSEVVKRVDADLGSLDMVIANAGVGGTTHASRLQWEDVGPMFDVNVRGAVATLLAAVPIMLAAQRGQLVGVSSLAGRRALPEAAGYSASKAALSVFLEAMRLDLAPAGIKVTDVQPGFVETPMLAQQTHPKPFKWTAEKAARVVANRLERGPAVIAFPWPLAFVTALARVLPAWLYAAFVPSPTK